MNPEFKFMDSTHYNFTTTLAQIPDNSKFIKNVAEAHFAKN